MKKWKVITDRGDFIVEAWSASDAAGRVTLATYGRQKIVAVRRA